MDNERDDLGTLGILSSITDIPRIVKEVHVYESPMCMSNFNLKYSL